MPLIGIYVLTLVVFFIFSFDKTFEKATLISCGFAHVTWGIVYHYIHKDLSPLLVLEYITIAALGIASVLTII